MEINLIFVNILCILFFIIQCYSTFSFLYHFLFKLYFFTLLFPLFSFHVSLTFCKLLWNSDIVKYTMHISSILLALKKLLPNSNIACFSRNSIFSLNSFLQIYIFTKNLVCINSKNIILKL